MSEPFDVSIIMPAYNAAAFIAEAIASLQSQHGVSAEIIVVDDGSSDGCDAIVERIAAKDPRVFLLRQRHGGVAAARNTGLAAARMPYVTFLDADDICVPGKIHRQLSKLSARPDVAAVVGHRISFETMTPVLKLAAGARATREVGICLASAVFRAELFQRFGGFDEKLAYGEDIDFYFRLFEADQRFIIEADTAIYYRRHAGNMTNNEQAMRQASVRAYHNSIVRRRLAGRTRGIDTFFFRAFDRETEFGGPATGATDRGRADMSPDAYTVIIPAFNAAETIAETLASIRGQTHAAGRIIVVDDGSTDDTVAVAGKAGADVLRQQHEGPGAACNRALAEVATPFVAYLDADDLWLPEKCRTQADMLAARPELAGVFGLVRLFLHGSPVEPNAPTREGWGRTTMFFRTERARQIGPIYDPPGGRGDLVDWIMRGRELGLLFEMQQSVVALRRIIRTSMSYGRDGRDAGYLDVVRRALERKRRAGAGPGGSA